MSTRVEGTRMESGKYTHRHRHTHTHTHTRTQTQTHTNIAMYLFSQCSALCDGTQRRRIECKLGNETLPAERCPIGKPSIFQRCSPECPVLEVCKKEHCHLDGLGSCPKECCNKCKVSLAQFRLTSLQRYNLCEKECCKKCV